MGSIIFERKDLTARVADDERVTDENSNSDAEVLGSSNRQIHRLQGGIHVAALKESYIRLLRPGRLSGCLAGRSSALRHLQRSIVPSAQRASNGSTVITKIGQELEKPHCGFQNQEIGESEECNAAVDRATGRLEWSRVERISCYSEHADGVGWIFF
ncbi:hypothetical protein GE21DRAFT_4435 [Neurospora crassa]|uniref:Uncharacterized protein n=1 Tax=Neurospora crassa (strain ATCC 24698 / 74-OR23-1A / CBS 708.71 / DSM 1257 / FGSC 987) TaxID=367110 RepID=Q7RWV0_NEUCR|nr:hypothetical protein NCU00143 [Neurospora crassa OR74A]EAA26960.1 hypothetical protein NCU00143 [Neurospora crassa OR74A]KHE89453.1 hypothetical protein GE21DRAFT_4435 [Neurospora crassa]|eukprot:XP_956196.1 hypothetical protein NCU00143 [Neurospora crassa OR74A]